MMTSLAAQIIDQQMSGIVERHVDDNAAADFAANRSHGATLAPRNFPS